MASASPPPFRLRARVGSRAAAVGLIVMLSSVMFAAAPARAACDVLHPTCVVETVEDTVDSATETVEDTVDSATETVDETVEETTETVEETVESVTGEADETVGGAVGPATGQVDDVIGGPSETTVPGVNPDPVAPPTMDPAPPGGGGGAGNGSDAEGSSVVGDQPAGAPLGGVAGPFVLDPSTLGGAPAIENTPAPRGFLSVLAGPAGEIASRIAFPLALALLVFLFVAFQDRLDGRDPKLALAATSPDVLRFG